MNKCRVVAGLLFFSLTVHAQDSVRKVMGIAELLRLVQSNSVQLKANEKAIEISRASTKIARSARLPDVDASAEAGYLSTITTFKPDFAWLANVPTPHFVNNYSIGANQVIYKGGAVRLDIAQQELGIRAAAIDYRNDRQDLQLQVLGKYLELLVWFNNHAIYASNIALSERRLRDLQRLREQGLVTSNDILRSEIQLADFRLSMDEAQYNLSILNNDLVETLGLGQTTVILPDTTLDPASFAVVPLKDYVDSGYTLRPSVQHSVLDEKIAANRVQLAKAARLPQLSVYARDDFQRPFLNTTEPINIYYNAWQCGLRLTYEISSLYHAKDHIRLANVQLEQQRIRTEDQRRHAETAIYAAWQRYQLATEEFATMQKRLQLANDNFRVVEKKYLNQLAAITDMLDASTVKLEAALRLSSAASNIVLSWYELRKETGTL